MSDQKAVARRLIKTAVRVGSSGVVRTLGADVTDRFVEASCLVVAPHSDDETFGCGATIARMCSLGTGVEVVFVTDGRQSPRPGKMTTSEFVALRRIEAAHALAALGVQQHHVTHLGFEDGSLSDRSAEIADALAGQVRRLAPARVLVTSVHDRHPDHAAVGHAAREAVVRAKVETRLYEYPIWQRVPAVTVVRDMAATVRVRGRGGHRSRGPQLVRTDPFLGVKRRAIAAYQSQLPHLPVGFVEDFLLSYESFTEVTGISGL